MAKQFFYVCAGLALLVLTLPFRPASVNAQGPSSMVGSFDGDTDPVLIDHGGSMWAMGWSNSRGSRVGPVPLPKVGAVIAISVSVMGPGNFDGRLLYHDGDAFIHDETGWHLVGNIVSGTTPAEIGSWGALKQRYR